MAIDSVVSNGGVPEESRRAISFVDGRGFMPGFLRGPLPQNYEASHVDAAGGCVAAQVVEFETNTGALKVNVKNPFSVDDSLELMTPEGMVPVEVSALVDFRGQAADRLNPGTEGRVFLQNNVQNVANNANFAFIVKKNLFSPSDKT
jgi:putative protease